MTNQVRHVANRSAAALAELAVVLTFLGFALLATIDFARAFHDSQIVQEAARAGALLASGAAYRAPGVRPEDAAQEAAAAAGAGLDPPLQARDVTVTFGSSDVTVTAAYEFQTLVNYPGVPRKTVITRVVTLPIAPSDPRWN